MTEPCGQPALMLNQVDARPRCTPRIRRPVRNARIQRHSLPLTPKKHHSFHRIAACHVESNAALMSMKATQNRESERAVLLAMAE